MTTLELALEGERLCKSGDFASGVAFFEAAIASGTEDLKTLSAIYSQLGNAYFFLGNYPKAVVYHRNDLTLARTMNDKLGEAKASGNLGNTLKLMGKFDEAILCCKRHLELADSVGDQVGISRALYNLANAYHAKAKNIGRLGQQDPGEFPQEVKECLEAAMEYYERNLTLTRTLGDRPAQGRACGNLGNVHYLMGNFSDAIRFHEQRLEIAKEFGDLNAQRRAYTNLGNAHVFSGDFEVASGMYRNSLTLSLTLGDRCVEAQACYSLGNTYTLLRNYPLAIEYHLRHLAIARELSDKVGEGRAYWSLGNAYSAMGSHSESLQYAKKHLRISRELNDQVGMATARTNVEDLRRVLGSEEPDVDEDDAFEESSSSQHTSGQENNEKSRRKSMQEMTLLRTPDVKLLGSKQNKGSAMRYRSGSVPEGPHPPSSLRNNPLSPHPQHHPTEEETPDTDAFFDMLTKVQADRLDDQRCEMPMSSTNSKKGPVGPIRANSLPVGGRKEIEGNNKRKTEKGSRGDEDKKKGSPDSLLDLISSLQSKRMDEQRAELPGSQEQTDEDEFFDMLIRCQGSRLDEQRARLPNEEEGDQHPRGLTVPDEDFFSLIARLQDKRMDDQRAVVKDDNRNCL